MLTHTINKMSPLFYHFLPAPGCQRLSREPGFPRNLFRKVHQDPEVPAAHHRTRLPRSLRTVQNLVTLFFNLKFESTTTLHLSDFSTGLTSTSSQ